MRKIIFSAGFLLLFAPLAFGQTVQVDTLCRKAYHEIMSLHFAPANALLKEERTLHPDNVYTDYLENYRDFLRVFIGEDQALFQQLDDTFDIRYARVKQLSDTSRYKQLLLANMNLQWAFARLKFGDYFAAAWELNKAYRKLSENSERFPGFVPDFISLGVMHVIIGLVPDQYSWMLKIISMHGSVEQGKKEIYRALDKASYDSTYAYLYPEALFYLGFIELNLSSGPQALQKLMGYLRETSDSNLLMDFLKADIYMRYGQNEKALQMLRKAPLHTAGYFPFDYLHYLQGECYLRKLETDSADRQFRLFLSRFKGQNYIKDTWRKRAWVAWLDKDTLDYYRYMDSVKVWGYDKVGADKEAEKEAEAGRQPNIDLLQARLLFDGGYYGRAEMVLDSMDTQNLSSEEKTERQYRYARIAHRLNKIRLAKEYYRETLQMGRHLPRYFAANAALKLGEIYESEDSLSLARAFYKQCLSLDFDEYVNSIRGKAKEALQRIAEKENSYNR